MSDAEWEKSNPILPTPPEIIAQRDALGIGALNWGWRGGGLPPSQRGNSSASYILSPQEISERQIFSKNGTYGAYPDTRAEAFTENTYARSGGPTPYVMTQVPPTGVRLLVSLPGMKTQEVNITQRMERPTTDAPKTHLLQMKQLTLNRNTPLSSWMTSKTNPLNMGKTSSLSRLLPRFGKRR